MNRRGARHGKHRCFLFRNAHCECPLRQDPKVESEKEKKRSFGLLKLDMAILGCLLRKMAMVL